jgi:hypothetical protein
MFDRDGPVAKPAADDGRVGRETLAVVGRYAPGEQDAILAGTAARVDRVDPVSDDGPPLDGRTEE